MRHDKGKEKEAEVSENFPPSTVHDPPLPYPQRLKQSKQERKKISFPNS